MTQVGRGGTRDKTGKAPLLESVTIQSRFARPYYLDPAAKIFNIYKNDAFLLLMKC
jgi:hypothetical protein